MEGSVSDSVSSQMQNEMSSDVSSAYYDYTLSNYHSFERDFFSNFMCCGRSLSSLHLLLEHFEDTHEVTVTVGSNGLPVYPTPVALMDEEVNYSPYPPSGPYSTPPSPAFSLSTAPSSDGCASPAVISEWHTSAPVMAVDGDKEAASNCVKPLVTVFDCEVHQHGIDIMVPETDKLEWALKRRRGSDTEFAGTTDVANKAVKTQKDGSASPSSLSTSEKGEDVRMGENVFVAELGTGNPSRVSGTKRVMKARRTNISPKERVYKCPRLGCTKAYLNSNGLRYHVDRGTCEFASDEEKR